MEKTFSGLLNPFHWRSTNFTGCPWVATVPVASTPTTTTAATMAPSARCLAGDSRTRADTRTSAQAASVPRTKTAATDQERGLAGARSGDAELRHRALIEVKQPMQR